MTLGQELDNVRTVLGALVGRRMVGPFTPEEEARYRLLCRRELDLLRAGRAASHHRRRRRQAPDLEVAPA